MASIEVGDPESIAPPYGSKKNSIDAEHLARVSTDLEKKVPGADTDKIDREVAKYASDVRIEISPERSAELCRKIDRRVLSVMVLTYFLQAIDKGTLSFAAIMGLLEDTGTAKADGSPNWQFPWLTTCIYIAILVVEYPQNYIIARVPIAKYLSFSIVAWGSILACHAACNDFKGLLIVRTLLGIFESACQPAFVILSAMWYRREEQASRVTYWLVK